MSAAAPGQFSIAHSSLSLVDESFHRGVVLVTRGRE